MICHDCDLKKDKYLDKQKEDGEHKQEKRK